jgi:hypothetical protein
MTFTVKTIRCADSLLSIAIRVETVLDTAQ